MWDPNGQIMHDSEPIYVCWPCFVNAVSAVIGKGLNSSIFIFWAEGNTKVCDQKVQLVHPKWTSCIIVRNYLFS